MNAVLARTGKIAAGSNAVSRLTHETVAVVLAGGKGKRLGALTEHDCKPALPFGGLYRNIDFSLSNCINSGINRIGVATQFKDASLILHLAEVWRNRRKAKAGGFILPWRAESLAEGTYRGTADAIYRNWPAIRALDPRLVLILAGDHVYQMDYRPMLMQHVDSGADVTIGCVEIAVQSAREFGVMSIDRDNRVLRFSEKPRYPESLPGRPDRALGSMGIYVFRRELLGKLLREDSLNDSSTHDFGRDVLPQLIGRVNVFAYPFTGDAVVGFGYWRDVGTVESYWQAHMDFLDGVPGLLLNDRSWPLWSNGHSRGAPVISTIISEDGGKLVNSFLARGCSVARATVHRSVLYQNVSVAPNTELWNAVVLPRAVIGRDCSLSDVVIAAGVLVPDGTVVEPRNVLHDATISPALLADTGNFSRNIVRPSKSGLINAFQRRHEHVKEKISGQ
jgi:glucose-1-phosphate adenylyltransferase